jgi:hypothetical protein
MPEEKSVIGQPFNGRFIYSIHSQKGGVGKTSVALALASIMAKGYNKKVLIVDADMTGTSIPLGPARASLEPEIDQCPYLARTRDPILPGLLRPGRLSPPGLDTPVRRCLLSTSTLVAPGLPQMRSAAEYRGPPPNLLSAL